MAQTNSRKIFWWDWVLLIFIICLAGFFRWRGINWDQNQHYHPDERYIAWVASSVDFLGNDRFADAFTTNKSTFNPFYWPAESENDGIALLKDEPRDFAYGHLPLYLGVAAENLTSWGLNNRSSDQLSEAVQLFKSLPTFDRVTLVGRWLSGLFDLATVVLVFILGRNLAGTKVGLTASLFLALNVMHIQQAHFFISDPPLAFFVVLTILMLVWSLPPKQEIFDAEPNPFPDWLWFAGMATGLAIGSKFSAIILGLPAFFVILILSRQKVVWRSIKYGLIVLIVFFITNPFAILDSSCALEFGDGRITLEGSVPGACYLQNITNQSTMVSGGNAFPFIRQYDGTLPYLYHIENQINWGMGVALGYVAFIAFLAFSIWAITYGVRDLRRETPSSIWVKGIIILGWCLPYFLTTGQFHTKFMRYLLPLTPFLMIFAAWLLWQIKWTWLRRTLIASITIFTLGYAIAFSSIYDRLHPWHVASIWIANNVPANSTVVNEAWDEYLPSRVRIDDKQVGRGRLTITDVNWLSQSRAFDSETKLAENLATLADGDYFVIPSNRSYGVVPRLTGRYPHSSQFHQLLFDGKLGYEVAFVQDRPPRIAGVHFVPDLFSWPNLTPPQSVVDYFGSRTQLMWVRADESFTVYDQPTVIIFRNTGNLSADEMLSQFDLIDQ